MMAPARDCGMTAADLRAALDASAHADAVLSPNYIVLTVGSCLIATLGLLENSAAVIIGAMIIAPLMAPIQAFAFAALNGDAGLARRALLTAAAGAAIAVVLSGLLGAIVALPTYGSEVLARTRPTLLDLLIAGSAGAVAGFAKVRPAIANTIAGTAIAVALMPPLCVVGLTAARRDWSASQGAALLFGTNFLGIALACMLVYVTARILVRHSGPAVLTTAGITLALVFPLGASFLEILRQARIEAEIRTDLTTDTVTFRHMRLIGARFTWYRQPVVAELDVSAANAVSTSQVRDLEAFVAQRTGQAIHLIMHVNRFETVSDTQTSVGG